MARSKPRTGWTKDEFDTIRSKASVSLRRWYKDERKALSSSQELGVRQMVESLRPQIGRGMAMGLTSVQIASKLSEIGVEVRPALLRSIMRETGSRRASRKEPRSTRSEVASEDQAGTGDPAAGEA